MSQEKQCCFSKILGEKVYLLPVRFEDSNLHANWLEGPVMLSSLGLLNAPLGLLSEKSYLEGISKKGGYNFAILTVEGDKLLGNCSIMNIENIHRYAELGLFIDNKSTHGSDYFVEAIKLLLSCAFKILNLSGIYQEVPSYNEKAVCFYREAGFKDAGKKRSQTFLAGRYWDLVLLDILKDEFKYPFFDDQCSKIEESFSIKKK